MNAVVHHSGTITAIVAVYNGGGASSGSSDTLAAEGDPLSEDIAVMQR